MSSTINRLTNDDALRLVFSFLNEEELRTASLVCKTWNNIGKEVNKRKEPICRIMTSRNMCKKTRVYSKIRTVLQCLEENALFCMFMSNTVEEKISTECCSCEFLSYNCYSLWIDCPSQRNKNLFKLTYMIFPVISRLDFNSYTFCCKYSPQGFYCPEIHFKSDIYFIKLCSIKCHLDRYFDLEKPFRYCLILWCREAKKSALQSVIKDLSQNFPGKKIPIWGGIAEDFVICNKKTGMCSCCTTADFIFLFLNGRDMEARTIIFDESCVVRNLIGRKFKNLSKSMKLKNHSIAFMYTSHYHLDLYKMESDLFKVFFPKVKLFHIIGKQPLGGTGLDGL
ncbi:hypothetical protein M0802_009595 [Mischocyttarus mexicanus]|nr:hypothetical protein M0802_009595 [Mischocyttarus mexicanus]